MSGPLRQKEKPVQHLISRAIYDCNRRSSTKLGLNIGIASPEYRHALIITYTYTLLFFIGAIGQSAQVVCGIVIGNIADIYPVVIPDSLITG